MVQQAAGGGRRAGGDSDSRTRDSSLSCGRRGPWQPSGERRQLMPTFVRLATLFFSLSLAPGFGARKRRRPPRRECECEREREREENRAKEEKSQRVYKYQASMLAARAAAARCVRSVTGSGHAGDSLGRPRIAAVGVATRKGRLTSQRPSGGCWSAARPVNGQLSGQNEPRLQMIPMSATTETEAATDWGHPVSLAAPSALARRRRRRR